MTDEEKKAIEKFKNFIYTYQDVIEDEYSDYEEKEGAKEYQEVSEKILNLIEKQSKEIEELKQEKEYLNCIIESDKDNYINKDKIKAKIEELAKQDRESIMAHNYLVIPVLQSLLEKDFPTTITKEELEKRWKE